MSAIQIESVSRVFDTQGRAVVALDNVSLEIKDQEFVAIVGPSGCGKTTLLRMVAGLDFPTSGRVRVGNVEVPGPGPDRAVVFQQFALFPWKNVAENIAFGLRCKGVSDSERRTQVREFVSMMGLEGHEDAFPHQLSGGMQQRVAIARSYALAPDVLLMDEPFGALDAINRERMQFELNRVWAAQEEKATIAFVTHDVNEAVHLGHRIMVMSRGPGRLRALRDNPGVGSPPHDGAAMALVDELRDLLKDPT